MRIDTLYIVTEPKKNSTAEQELRHFYESYGHMDTLYAIAELLESIAIRMGDEGENDERTPFDDAAEIVRELRGHSVEF